eukprot:CAMPEP_0206445488 /NCGR_PEP_ID=MMETSP0324_2-20121206/15547_1 /ASSEMBLY_ACC=CAM_ASM_000836 /TAXON_ID=2866 /ORGANISM="Crypthecodinium cohnii, Strain Seligo" /LENGTH=612 /DNA_ID=CAMNT_0053913731 /DNA_START=72 /DNA_END=1910 /DNA_ORIENTATION=+
MSPIPSTPPPAVPTAPPPTWLSSSNLGILSDTVSVADKGVAFGFGIARAATGLGFGIASTCISAPATLVETAAGPNIFSSALRGVGGIVNFAHGVTTASQNTAEYITSTSLKFTRSGLAQAGAQEGQLMRIAVGSETAETLAAIDGLARQLAAPALEQGLGMGEFITSANAWGALQRGAGLDEVRIHPTSIPVAKVLPAQCERWLRYAAATFGHTWLAGLLEGANIDGYRRGAEKRRAGASPGEAALACAGLDVDNVDVLTFKESTQEMFVPGYMVAVDHAENAVVVAFRGTSSIADALCDLSCLPEPVVLGGVEGMAHGGMLRAAQGLSGPLSQLVARGLQILDAKSPRHLEQAHPRRVVITGHSLGAGVASLLTALWCDSPPAIWGQQASPSNSQAASAAAAATAGTDAATAAGAAGASAAAAAAAAVADSAAPMDVVDDVPTVPPLEAPQVPGTAGVSIECLAFACPQVLDARLAEAQSEHTMSFIVGDDMVPRLSYATVQDLRNAVLLLSRPGATRPQGLPTPAEILQLETAGEIEALGRAYAALKPLVATSPGRLFPSGRLVQLPPNGGAAWEVDHSAVDELRISSDMGAAHLPRRCLLAVQEACKH